MDTKLPYFAGDKARTMPLFFLDENELWFPNYSEMSGDIVATGGDLTAERLILAYSMGIFPWYNEPGNIMWWCPEDRAVVFTDELHISHSMRNIINRGTYRWTMDQAFLQVMEGCRGGPRAGHTWIFDETIEAYHKLHLMGYCHSIEVWEDNKLVGGLYGVSLGRVFFGESMFSLRPNASKFGFIQLTQFLRNQKWKIIDCQQQNSYLATLGARNIPRDEFLAFIKIEMKYPTIKGNWGDPGIWKNPVKTPHQP